MIKAIPASDDTRRLLAESIGTFFLVLIGPGAAIADSWTRGAVTHVGVSLAFTFVVTAMVYALGGVSGAHINPAVTVALWSVRRFNGHDVIRYVGAQCAGAIVAAGLWRVLLGSIVSAGTTQPAIPVAGAFAVEMLLSFALMLVIMAVATGDRAGDGTAAIAIGLTVGFCALAGGPLTGASMNPARSLGPAAMSGLWNVHWLYWLAPISGMISAAHTYQFLRRRRAT